MASCARARELSGLRSKSPASRRHRPVPAKVRATTRRRGMTSKPSVSFDLPTISRMSGNWSSFGRSRKPVAPVPAVGKYLRDPPGLVREVAHHVRGALHVG